MPIVERVDAAGHIPEEYLDDIFSEATAQSVALQHFTRITIPTQVNRLPILSALPVATWVSGEPSDIGVGGEKTATNMAWANKTITAEELAAIVVIPEAVLEDAKIDLWQYATEQVGAAIGRALDAAAFAGTNAPATFPTGGIAGEAVTAGNVIVNATPDQTDYNDALGLVEADGHMPTSIFAALDQAANFRGFNAAGVPIYLDNVKDGETDRLYGKELILTSAVGASKAVVGDKTKAVVGVRKDLTYKVLDQATINLGGANEINLAQQDALALRVRARFGFTVATPATPENATGYPFAVINTV